MLVLMALVLLAVTFFIWTGVPFFIISSLVAELTSNFVIVYLCISLSGGILFSLYFVPLHLKVAKNIGNIITRNCCGCLVLATFLGVALNITMRLVFLFVPMP